MICPSADGDGNDNPLLPSAPVAQFESSSTFTIAITMVSDRDFEYALHLLPLIMAVKFKIAKIIDLLW